MYQFDGFLYKFDQLWMGRLTITQDSSAVRPAHSGLLFALGRFAVNVGSRAALHSLQYPLSPTLSQLIGLPKKPQIKILATSVTLHQKLNETEANEEVCSAIVDLPEALDKQNQQKPRKKRVNR